MSQSIFLDTIQGKKCSRPPVWFMRQAGRVLPRYMALREKHSFHELMRNPQLAADVTLLPVDDLGVDAAILFSDILVIPEALGMHLEFTDKGPDFTSPIKNNYANISKLQADPQKLSHIYEAIKLTVAQKPKHVGLIGFCGGPFTTFCYMVQGNSINHTFTEAIQLLYSDKKACKQLFDVITDLSIEYAVNQVTSGIDTFQIFETHAGLIPADLYVSFVLPYVAKISKAVKDLGCPTIFFPKGLARSTSYITKDIADYVSIDWQDSLSDARASIPSNIGVQGNLDPRLFNTTDKSVLIEQLESYKKFGSKNYNWIFNTGHGLSPENNLENIKTTINWIKTTDWQRD